MRFWQNSEIHLHKTEVETSENIYIAALQIPQNIVRNVFLTWEISSQIKKILEYFSQNKKNKLTEKIFLSLLQENLTWIKNNISKQD